MSPDPKVPARHAGSPVDDEALAAMLTGWLPGQRWFAGPTGGSAVVARLRRQCVLSEPDIDVEQVIVTTGLGARYQVFVGWRSEAPERLAHAIIGQHGGRFCFDALADPVFADRIYDVLHRGGELGAVTGRPEADVDVPTGLSGLVLGAEQSNTSLKYGDEVIVKVFRRIEPGVNPDAELLRGLHRVGCDRVPQPVGVLTGVVDGVSTTLALGTRFFANSADGWTMATTSVRDLMAEADLRADEVGGDFAAESHRLGAAVVAVHDSLAEAFGSRTADAGDTAQLFATMRDRARAGVAAAPELRPLAGPIDAAYDRLESQTRDHEIRLQRIHGDLHLGQTLRTVDGWVLIDFEGEPLRPLAARMRPGSPLKDVAGMIRSFHYAAHQPLLTTGSDAQHDFRAGEWAQRNIEAFCRGYAEGGGDPREQRALLHAFELTKAIYEVGYERAHRPGWEYLPLRAVRALTDT